MGMVSPTGATASLISQIIVLGLLAVAVAFKNRKKYRQHGTTMAAAVVLHLSTVLAVMAPSFSGFFTRPEPIAINAVTVIVFLHVILGLTTALGIWLVTKWRFSKEACSARKRVMKLTLTLWVTTFLLGVILYIAYWTGPPPS